MVGSISNNQAPDQEDRGRVLGKFATILLMVTLCMPFGFYVNWLNDQYSATVALSELRFGELLVTGVLLLVPFVVLRLLRMKWQAER
ncbi:MAG: hypothetical protein OQL20_05700 [Sedimenticola sp.]|nr:hypothetical protein [Sedimenticola sp.]